jgi:nitrogen fixation protein FixH
MKKLSWGTGIVLVIAGFFIVMAVMITIAMTHGTDLVTENYYDKELKYQDRITSVRRTAAIKDCIRMTQDGGILIVTIAGEATSSDLAGSIVFYNPADKRKDFAVAMALDSARSQRIATATIAKGLWKVQASWTAHGGEYFSEQPLVIN